MLKRSCVWKKGGRGKGKIGSSCYAHSNICVDLLRPVYYVFHRTNRKIRSTRMSLHARYLLFKVAVPLEDHSSSVIRDDKTVCLTSGTITREIIKIHGACNSVKQSSNCSVWFSALFSARAMTKLPRFPFLFFSFPSFRFSKRSWTDSWAWFFFFPPHRLIENESERSFCLFKGVRWKFRFFFFFFFFFGYEIAPVSN